MEFVVIEHSSQYPSEPDHEIAYCPVHVADTDLVCYRGQMATPTDPIQPTRCLLLQVPRSRERVGHRLPSQCESKLNYHARDNPRLAAHSALPRYHLSLFRSLTRGQRMYQAPDVSLPRDSAYRERHS